MLRSIPRKSSIIECENLVWLFSEYNYEFVGDGALDVPNLIQITNTII